MEDTGSSITQNSPNSHANKNPASSKRKRHQTRSKRRSSRQGSGGASSPKRRKRKIEQSVNQGKKGDSSQEDEDDVNDGFGGEGYVIRMKGQSEPEFTCPFILLDPRRYQDCWGKTTTRFADVTQHISRHHLVPSDPYCSNCFKSFQEPVTRDLHFNGCHDQVPLERFSIEELSDLKKTIAGDKSKLRKWFPLDRLPQTDDLCVLRWHLMAQKYFGLVNANPFKGDMFKIIMDYAREGNHVQMHVTYGSPATTLADIEEVAYRTDVPPRYRRSQYSPTIGRVVGDATTDTQYDVGIVPTYSNFLLGAPWPPHALEGFDPSQDNIGSSLGAQNHVLAPQTMDVQPADDNGLGEDFDFFPFLPDIAH